MPAYTYHAIDPSGKTQKGVLEGDSEKQIRQKLREQKLLPVDIKIVSDAQKTQSITSRFKRVKLADLALFTRQLATLLLAGIPLEEALESVAEQTEKKHFKAMVMAVRSSVLEGSPLATAMAQFPSVFSQLYRASIHAGEQTGKLDQILNRLADYIENQQVIKQKVQQALIYPSLMIIVSIAIVTFLLIYVVPKIISVFQDSKQTLPMVTQILLGISHFLAAYGLFLGLFLIIAFYGFQKLLRQEKYRTQWDLFLLKLPWINYVIKTVNTARFSRTLGMLNSSGVPIIEALKVATQLLSSIPIREKVKLAAEQITQGTSIAKALKETHYFSPMTLHLIANGEMSGQLEKMLEKAAEVQETAMTRLIDTGLTLFEPLIILLMGGIVLFIVLAILLPIFQLDQVSINFSGVHIKC